MSITKLYQTQISLTEWFQNINHEKTEILRKEDNDKRERLNVLNKIINLPFDKPYNFKAIELVNQTEEFKEFLKQHGEELCALRLIPIDESLPKLRMRGHKIKDSLKWFSEQKIDATKYKADFVPHSDNNLWSTIFIVNKKGIFGEIIKGGHHQLTQGFYENEKPIIFYYDFNNWKLSKENEQALVELKKIIIYINVENLETQELLFKELKSTFVNGFIEAYFETVTTEENGLWFIDYNKTLSELYADFIPELEINKSELIKGQVGNKGKITGKVKIITKIENVNINKDEVLVCEMTTPEHIKLMKNSSAIITDKGGILSHAAIVSRELKIPCIVGTKNATQILKDGDIIEVDADKGIVKIIKRN